MNEILNNVIATVISALVLALLGLNTKRVIHSQSKPIHWIWKLLKSIGKFMFFYGLIVFLLNMALVGAGTTNTAIGASVMCFGLIFWIVSNIIIAIKS